MVEKLKEQIVVMELPLADGDRVLFFCPRPVYDHTDLTEKGHSGEFYYYNSGTCPINWLSDVIKVVHVSSHGEVDTDPHGVFRLAGIFHEGDYVPEMATNTVNGVTSEFVDCVIDADVASQKLIDINKTIDTLLDTTAADADVIAAWRTVMYDKLALYSLSRRLYETNAALIIDLAVDHYSLCRTRDIPLTVVPESTEEFARVKFLVEFEILYACSF